MPGTRGVVGSASAGAVGRGPGGRGRCGGSRRREACLRWDQGARGETSGAAPSIAKLKAAASILHPIGSRGLEGGERPPHHPVGSRGGFGTRPPKSSGVEGSVARDLSPV